MRVAVLGLGEAGALIASDLVAAGDEVRGHDPGPVATPTGVRRHDSAREAVEGCGLVIALTPGGSARDALETVLDSLGPETVYADLSTGSPGSKAELAALVANRGASFADVALMSPVPGRGLGAPALVSGSGATRYAELVNARGGSVEVVGPAAGEAASRKLLRSVVTKGLAGVLMEAMEGAEATGRGEWMWNHVVELLTGLDEPMLRRLVAETPRHARRRLEEMEAVREMLAGLGVPSPMTEATIARLRRLVAGGTSVSGN
jgi:3-hydroxyisobutyrate dehydrogenase-like beta-hydroxyacid dehydrogenase